MSAASQCFGTLWMMIPMILTGLLLLPDTISGSTHRQPNTDGFYVYDFLRSMGVDVDVDDYDVDAQPIGTVSSICPWKGVKCDIIDSTATEPLDDDTDPQSDTRITGLSVPNLGLRGVIPENTVGKLRGLRHLDLSRNLINGGFPSDFWGLGGSLRSINVSFNRFTGPLPNDVGNLGLLEVLDASHNNFSGDIPASVASLGSVRHVDLSHNAFEGSVPDGLLFLGIFGSLVALDLSSNRLNGVLPVVEFSAAGRQPEPVIRYLNLSRNSLGGSLGAGLFRLPLQVLDVSDNEFDAADGLGDAAVYSPRLKHLNLGGNYRSSMEFPAGVCELTELEYLNLSSAGLTGKIPTDISKLTALKTLDISRNHLTGAIPGKLPSRNLKFLDMSWNNLTGQVPTSLLHKLMKHDSASTFVFNVSYNHLTFCSANLGIPPETIWSMFIGSEDDCPIAVDVPHNLTTEDQRSRKGPKKVERLVIAVSLSALFFLVGLVCLAIGFSRGTAEQQWVAAKHRRQSYRDGGEHDADHVDETQTNNLSGLFSSYSDSSTWVADVKAPKSVPVVIFEKPLLNLTFADLLLATSHFDRGMLLAEGKFGPVYRGFLPGGIHVAVKVLLATRDVRSSFSTLTDREAEWEFERLGRVKHPNLVPLIGYCVAAGGRLRIAMYEYMENGTLQSLIHDLPLGVVQAMGDDDYCWASDDDDEPWEFRTVAAACRSSSEHRGHHGGLITWRFRHRIALGVARALAFLHHGCSPQIIHRDVKASSIFLDAAFEARLSDSGLARLAGNTEEGAAVIGQDNEFMLADRSPTGYTPPETQTSDMYPVAAPFTTSTVTTAKDVYGFGVVLFELITGKKPVGDNYPETRDATSTLVSWVRGLVRKNQAWRAIDPKIRDTGSKKQMEEGLRIGYLCTADHPSKRPSMHQIVGLLKDIEPKAADRSAVVDL